MRFDKLATCIMVRKNYGEYIDFYAEKFSLVAASGNRNNLYISFAITWEKKVQ